MTQNPFDEQNTEDAAGIKSNNNQWEDETIKALDKSIMEIQPTNPNDDKWYQYPLNPKGKTPKKPAKPLKKNRPNKPKIKIKGK